MPVRAWSERGRSGAVSKANKTISLGSPIQMAVMKMAAFSFISKAFLGGGCFVFSDFINLYFLGLKLIFIVKASN